MSSAKKKKGIKKFIENRSIKTSWYYAIKWIAIITMIIDHLPQSVGREWSPELQLTMRIIGRIAFPLFAWELVECFHHTKNEWKHLFKIGVLAIISEVPFDRALKGSWIYPDCQNVCFTFLIGWLMLICLNVDWTNLYLKMGLKKDGFLNKLFSKSTGLSLCLPLFFLAYYLKVDFSYFGVGLVLFFEFARKRKHRAFWETFTILVYTGVRGTVMAKYYCVCYLCLILFFLAEHDKSEKEDSKIRMVLENKTMRYIAGFFYPLHLIILAILTEIIK